MFKMNVYSDNIHILKGGYSLPHAFDYESFFKTETFFVSLEECTDADRRSSSYGSARKEYKSGYSPRKKNVGKYLAPFSKNVRENGNKGSSSISTDGLSALFPSMKNIPILPGKRFTETIAVDDRKIIENRIMDFSGFIKTHTWSTRIPSKVKKRAFVPCSTK